MVSLTILESGFIRRSRALAPFEDGAQWPQENFRATPTRRTSTRSAR